MTAKKSESAVSEVIGTVLVVALFVIMAAFVAAYVFGMMNGIPMTRVVAVTADQIDYNHMIVTYRGGPDAGILQNLSIIWPSGKIQTVDFPKIGDVYTATNINPPYNVTAGQDHVVVSAIFANNMSQVALDTWI
jgi:archaeal type IV pilus assembly protein PilA